jgi:hypothetical protein
LERNSMEFLLKKNYKNIKDEWMHDRALKKRVLNIE